MSIKEPENLLSLFGSMSLGMAIGGGVVFLIFKFFLPSYLSQKAKNLATKEDIAGITDEIEGVKVGYAKILEEVRAENQHILARVEREKILKKEVYLDAAEAVTRSHNMVSSFSNLNITTEELTANMASDSAIMAKVQIVGSRETVKTTTEFMAAIGTATMDLLLERQSLIDRKVSIDHINALRQKSEQEIDRYIQMMKGLNLQGNQNESVWETIDGQVKFEQQQIHEFDKSLSELWSEQTKEHFAYTEKCISSFFDISEFLPPIVLAIREELELDISHEDYLDIFNKNMETGRKVLKDFLDKVGQYRA